MKQKISDYITGALITIGAIGFGVACYAQGRIDQIKAQRRDIDLMKYCLSISSKSKNNDESK